MATILSFRPLAESVIASYNGRDGGFPNRLQFWIARFGERDITSLTTDDIEDDICTDKAEMDLLSASKQNVLSAMLFIGPTECLSVGW
jgi:hypothetical protein